MNAREALCRLIAGEPLSAHESEAVFGQLMCGSLTPAQIGALLAALATKGETVDEILGAARALRAVGVPLPITAANAVDTCGTGGDGQQSFNVSTAASFIAAGAGVVVVKHGNRAMSGTVGAADVLEELGVRIDLTPAKVAECVSEVGIGFAFAQRFHPAMRHAAPVRRELGVRTVFNLLGPIVNPAGVRRQVIGVFSAQWLEVVARVAQRLESLHVMVVHGEDGLDEISLHAPTAIAELRDGEIRTWTLRPTELGFAPRPAADIRIAGVAAAAGAIRSVLGNEDGPLLDIATLNAAAAIYVSGTATDLKDGVDRAREAVSSGAARAKLEALVTVSNR